MKITAISGHFLMIVLGNGDLRLAHALRLMASSRQLCAEVRAAIPVMPWLDFKGFEENVYAADVLRAVRMHGPGPHLRGVDMHYLWRISIFEIQRIVLEVDAKVSGVSIGNGFASKDKMRVSMRLVQDRNAPSQNELWLQVSNYKHLYNAQAQEWEDEKTRKEAIFMRHPDEFGGIGAFVRAAISMSDPAHGLHNTHNTEEGRILNVVSANACAETDNELQYFDVFLGYAETKQGLLGSTQSSTYFFYAYLLQLQQGIVHVEDLIAKIPWRLSSTITEELKLNLAALPQIDARVAAMVPFEVAEIESTNVVNTDVHALSRFFKIERHGRRHSLEQIVQKQSRARRRKPPRLSV